MAKKDNELTNFYAKLPSHLKPKYHNPNYNKTHQITLPFRALCIGGSGSGKTTMVLELIKRMSGTFQLIILCCKSSNEPLYELLKSKLDSDSLHIYENGIIPEISEYADLDEQILMIFDDLVLDKDQRQISEYFIRGRKIAKGISLIYLSQTYFGVPKIIRLQCNFIFLKKLSSLKDLGMILSDYNLGIDKTKLLNIYEKATQNKRSFLTIDLESEHQHRYKMNFLENIKIS